VPADLTQRIDLTDPELFATGAFWPVLAWLRANQPVYRHPEPDGPGFWVVTRHADVTSVYASHEDFSSRFGMRLDSNADAVAAVAQRMLIVSDPPDHTALKRVLARAFGPAEVPRLEELARRAAREVVTQAVAAGQVDMVDVARKLPNHVVCALMGIPRADWEWVGATTTDAFESDDEEARAGAHGEIFLYFDDLLAQRRDEPGEDFISQIVHDRRATAQPGASRPLTDEEVIFNCNGVLAGGNETTRYSAAGGALALAQRPGQWQALSQAGPAAVPAAVEEVLRWTVPGVHAMRTAMRPAEIAGTRIAPGDRVTIWNVSANRDEAVFEAADEFRADRSPNRHLTFGAGRHLCLGARLARLELTAFLTELTDRVAGLEVTGDPVYNSSNFTWGLRALPLRLIPR
jgi:cytochrome P450